MKRLENVALRTKNVVIQDLQHAQSEIYIIIGNGYSLELNNRFEIIQQDPFMKFPSIKEFGENINIYSFFFSFSCTGLKAAAKDLADWINNHLANKNVVLLGHSKCGSCFIKAAEYLKEPARIIAVTAPLNSVGTPVVDSENFGKKLNFVEKIFYKKIFSNHQVDKDLSPNSEFLKSIDRNKILSHRVWVIVAKTPRFSLNPLDLFLIWFNKSKQINGDGIIPYESQFLEKHGYFDIKATHASSLKQATKLIHYLGIL